MRLAAARQRADALPGVVDEPVGNVPSTSSGQAFLLPTDCGTVPRGQTMEPFAHPSTRLVQAEILFA